MKVCPNRWPWGCDGPHVYLLPNNRELFCRLNSRLNRLINFGLQEGGELTEKGIGTDFQPGKSTNFRTMAAMTGKLSDFAQPQTHNPVVLRVEHLVAFRGLLEFAPHVCIAEWLSRDVPRSLLRAVRITRYEETQAGMVVLAVCDERHRLRSKRHDRMQRMK